MNWGYVPSWWVPFVKGAHELLECLAVVPGVLWRGLVFTVKDALLWPFVGLVALGKGRVDCEDYWLGLIAWVVGLALVVAITLLAVYGGGDDGTRVICRGVGCGALADKCAELVGE